MKNRSQQQEGLTLEEMEKRIMDYVEKYEGTPIPRELTETELIAKLGWLYCTLRNKDDERTVRLLVHPDDNPRFIAGLTKMGIDVK